MSDNSNNLELPRGFGVRAPNLGDLPEVFNLLTACDLAHLGMPDTVLEDLREEWEEVNLEQDAFLVLGPDGRPAGLATVNGQATMRVDAYVHPQYGQLGLEEYLRRVTENRAREMRGHGQITLETWVSSRQQADIQLLCSMGYKLTERYRRMRIDMDAPPLDPEWPEGIAMRTAVVGEDERAVYELLEAANSDNPQHEPTDYASWLRLMVETYRYEPSLWWLALQGDKLVGAALGVQFPDEGWVRLVGVRKDWRRRGIATALLRTAFGEFWRRGFARVELGVDPDSPYGAQRIYERAGMRVAFELVKYQKELRHP